MGLWGRVGFVCIPIGHAGTTLIDTVNDFAAALTKVRPSIASERKQKRHKTPDMSSAALLHDKRIARTLLNKLCSLAQTRLLDIITHKQKLIREQAATIPNHTTLEIPFAKQTAPKLNSTLFSDLHGAYTLHIIYMRTYTVI